MPQKYLSIEGVSTFVYHAGPTTLPGVAPDRSRGRTVVCLHDAGGHAGFLAALVAQLSETQSPLAFDQPAHGRSAGLDSLGSIERMVWFTGAFCAKLGLERPVLLGHGLGAAVALQLALDQPQAVEALVLCSCGARSDLEAVDLDRMLRVSQGKERRAFPKAHYSRATPPEVLRDAFMQGLKTDPRATCGDLQALVAWNVEDRLAELSLPALVVRGADETERAAASADALSRALTGAPALAIESAGHMLPFERPAELADAVASFLGGLP